MLDPIKHKTVLVTILNDIYKNIVLRKTLGFKGGTAAMLFYQLPRLSVDLDFDLLNPQKEALVFAQVPRLLKSLGTIKDSRRKRYTLFFLLNYQPGQRNVKIEISRRQTSSQYQIRNLLGVSMPVMEQNSMTANKIAAILTRKAPAARDYFDLWFFLKSGWNIDPQIVKDRTQLDLNQALAATLKQAQQREAKFFLVGMGELLDPSQKNWVKNNLLKELEFQLKLRLL